jgi:hypothetical protein
MQQKTGHHHDGSGGHDSINLQIRRGKHSSPVKRLITTIITCAIFLLSVLNIVLNQSTLPMHNPEHVMLSSFNEVPNLEEVCNNGHLPPFDESQQGVLPGSTARSILPSNLYPTIHHSCFFMPTTPKRREIHFNLLQYYPNSYLVLSSPDEPKAKPVRIENHTIYIHGIEEYSLLWIKTLQMWEFISSESNSLFKDCQWFFKVDTDAFLNLHVLEQYLSEYSYHDDHYVGWFVASGRPYNTYHLEPTIVNIAVGAFYGVSRSILESWNAWVHDKKFVWGSDHKGEDSQVAFFLREHNVCLDIPVVDAYGLRERGGVWGGFERGHPFGPAAFRAQCTNKVQNMLGNECFVYAHEVSLPWMPILAQIMVAHVVNKTKCNLFRKGVSRVVNGTIYQSVEQVTGCADFDCDPCLKDAINSCCGWKRTNIQRKIVD